MHHYCNNMASPEEQEPLVHCWGCTKLILVPCLDGKPAEMFKVSFMCFAACGCTAWTNSHTSK